MSVAMRHGAACRDGLAECDWPDCYDPRCVACGSEVPFWPLWRAEPNGAASGPYCDACGKAAS